MSIAGGLARAVERGLEVGCSVVQIFLKNQRQWTARPYADSEVREFRAAWKASGIRVVFAHANYLINLATPVPAEWRRAVDVFQDELERAEALGLPFVVIHPGSHRETGLEEGIRRIARAIDRLHERTRGYRVRVVLENTAGGGSSVGRSFEELAAIVAAVRGAGPRGHLSRHLPPLRGGLRHPHRDGYRDAMGRARPAARRAARARVPPQRRTPAARLRPRPAREDRPRPPRRGDVPAADERPALRPGPDGARDAEGSGAARGPRGPRAPPGLAGRATPRLPARPSGSGHALARAARPDRAAPSSAARRAGRRSARTTRAGRCSRSSSGGAGCGGAPSRSPPDCAS